MPESFQLWFTIVILIGMTIALVREWTDISLTIFSALILFVIGDIITIQEAFSGFSNVGVISIALLFIVAGALKSTGVIDQLSNLIFGTNRSGLRRKIFRMMLPITGFSAFINNTPIVAMLIPGIKSWAEKSGISPSKFLIPLSYAAILGGMCTLIGTSTNLIVHGLLIQNGYPGFSFFELTPIGLPIAFFGIIFISLFASKFLPSRVKIENELADHAREFVIELKVTNDFKGINKTIEEAGLRHLKGLFLFQIERDGKIYTAVDSAEKLKLNDRLFFTGIPQTIVELQKTPGLQLIKDSSFDLKSYDSDQVTTFEAVISHTSPLVGKNVRDSHFRTTYSAVILAIHRNGERIKKKIGDIVLKPGDTLLLLAPKSFFPNWYNSNDFYLISGSSSIDSKPRAKAVFSVVVLVLMILLVTLNVLSLVSAAGLASVLLILTRTISPSKAKHFVDFQVLIVIASAFGIAQAISNSGVAELLAKSLLTLNDSLGVIGVMAGVYYLTSIYNTIITSNATAALIFPIALTTALEAGMPVHPFALIVAFASAASFASPLSYQTNLMVYGPGGYKFKDYIKIGLPLQVLIGIITVGSVYYLYF